jgi:hypothetical protein
VAGIYGRVLKDLGLLSKGDVVVRVPSDFIGSALGESEKKTKAILEAAKGCVLVIDEVREWGVSEGVQEGPSKPEQGGEERGVRREGKVVIEHSAQGKE